MKKIPKKYFYIISLTIILLTSIITIPTYASFTSDYISENDIVAINFNFDIGISNIEEYEQITVEKKSHQTFNIELNNSDIEDIYYGLWYKPSTNNYDMNKIEIGKLSGTTTPTTGPLASLETTTISIAITNDTDEDIRINIGVNTSKESKEAIEYLGGKKLITNEVDIPKDIDIINIEIDGKKSNSLPTNGLYKMTATCSKGTTLTWDPYQKKITIPKNSYLKDKCSLSFQKDTPTKKLTEAAVGSYVNYEGKAGQIGKQEVSCQTKGASSNVTETENTESPNSCLGENARQDLENTTNIYGFCYSSHYKYTTTGWRIAYIKDDETYLISAASPECTNNQALLNTIALKYCNPEFATDNCTCPDNNQDGICDTKSTDIWNINDTDFYYITKSISGTGKRLTSTSSSLGEESNLVEPYCANLKSAYECGYHNDLIDNGGFYWFDNTSQTYFSPVNRTINEKNTSQSLGIRIIVKIKSSTLIEGGSGTLTDPYQITGK